MQNIIGSKDPIIIEFTYDDWKRLERLSNRDNRWIEKLYDAILTKARLISLAILHERFDGTLDITKITFGRQAYKRFEEVIKLKYPDREARGWLSLEFSPVESRNPELKGEILIYPDALRLAYWEAHVFI
jgi:hypothetical protein